MNTNFLIRDIIKEEDMHISKGAIAAIRIAARFYMGDITKAALTYTKEAGRKIIQEKDVMQVVDKFGEKDAKI